MLNHMQRVAATEPKSPPSSMPAPRVRVRLTEAGPSIEPTLDEAANPEDFRAEFLSAFGTVNELVAEALFTQLLNGLHTDPAKAVDSAPANLALALMHEIAPKDVVEGMLACQMVVAHVATMDASRRALHVEQTAGGRATYLSLSRKLMALFTAQMDALNRHRGKGTTQKIVIERSRRTWRPSCRRRDFKRGRGGWGIIRAVNLPIPSGCAGWRLRELPIGVAHGQGVERSVRLQPCRTADAAFTVVGALAHPEANATVVGAAGSTRSKR